MYLTTLLCTFYVSFCLSLSLSVSLSLSLAPSRSLSLSPNQLRYSYSYIHNTTAAAQMDALSYNSNPAGMMNVTLSIVSVLDAQAGVNGTSLLDIGAVCSVNRSNADAQMWWQNIILFAVMWWAIAKFIYITVWYILLLCYLRRQAALVRSCPHDMQEVGGERSTKAPPMQLELNPISRRPSRLAAGQAQPPNACPETPCARGWKEAWDASGKCVCLRIKLDSL